MISSLVYPRHELRCYIRQLEETAEESIISDTCNLSDSEGYGKRSESFVGWYTQYELGKELVEKTCRHIGRVCRVVNYI